MMWPAIAAAAGALLQAAPGVVKMFKKKKKINPLLQRMNWAKAAGIHPIYALGGSFDAPYGGSPMSWGDGFGEALYSLGGGLRDVGDYFEQDAERADRERHASEARSRVALDRAEDRAYQQRMEREQAGRDLEAKRFNDAQIKLIEAQTRSELMRQRNELMGASGGGNSGVPRLPFGLSSIIPTFAGGTAADAQTYQNRYGEGAEYLGGALKLLEDYFPYVNPVMGASGPAQKLHDWLFPKKE